VLQALFDLEATNNELKADLRDLYITSAKEVDAGSRKAIIVHVSWSAGSRAAEGPQTYKEPQLNVLACSVGRWSSLVIVFGGHNSNCSGCSCMV
jgi:hypothetical protein